MKKRVLRAAVCVVSVLMFYVLSSGPALWFLSRYPDSRERAAGKVLKEIYSPVHVMAGWRGVFGTVITRYLLFWQKLGDSKPVLVALAERYHHR